MSIWIFQAVPDRYDLRQKIVEGTTDTWYATRYRNQMKSGDLVFFWLAGDRSIRGIYGWGRLTSEPYPKPEWDSYGVDVEYLVRLESPLHLKEIISDPVLDNLLILRAPQATNFLLSPEEAQAIIRLIEPALRPEGVR